MHPATYSEQLQADGNSENITEISQKYVGHQQELQVAHPPLLWDTIGAWDAIVPVILNLQIL